MRATLLALDCEWFHLTGLIPTQKETGCVRSLSEILYPGFRKIADFYNARSGG